MASRIATDGGTSGLNLLSARAVCLFSFIRCGRLRSCGLSFWLRGIMTGEDGVVGLELSVDVVVAVLDDMSFVFASGLLFLSGRSYFLSR